jgi:hypothetical protein
MFGVVDPRIALLVGAVVIGVLIGAIVVTGFVDRRRDKQAPDDPDR